VYKRGTTFAYFSNSVTCITTVSSTISSKTQLQDYFIFSFYLFPPITDSLSKQPILLLLFFALVRLYHCIHHFQQNSLMNYVRL